MFANVGQEELLHVVDEGVAIVAEVYGPERVVVGGVFFGFWGEYAGDLL